MRRPVSSPAWADWRDRLVHHHPRLFPDAHLIETLDGPSLASAGRPNIPEGWRSIAEILCERLSTAIVDEPEAEIALLDMKEKYGALRLTVGTLGLSEPASEAVGLALDLAEARSTRTCELCGEPGRLMQRAGWYATRCPEHAEEFEALGSDAGVTILFRQVEGRLVRMTRRYDLAHDRFIDVPLPEEV